MEVVVSCGGAEHRVVVDGDRLLMEHALGAERVLVALGADVAPCILLFEAWERLRPRCSSLLRALAGEADDAELLEIRRRYEHRQRAVERWLESARRRGLLDEGGREAGSSFLRDAACINALLDAPPRLRAPFAEHVRPRAAVSP